MIQRKKAEIHSSNREGYSLSELLWMVKEQAEKENIKSITSASHAFSLLVDYSDKMQEHFICVTLDGQSRVIATRVVFVGTINQSLVHPREVFVDAILDRAVGIIIAHNHPSGSLEPSRADKETTTRIKDASKIIGIELLDHLIISKNGFFSFQEEGLL